MQKDKTEQNQKIKAASLRIKQALPTVAFLCFLLCLTLFVLEFVSYRHLLKEQAALRQAWTAVPPIAWDSTQSTELPTSAEVQPSAEEIPLRTETNPTEKPPQKETLPQTQGDTCIVNTKSKKIHKPTCRYAEKTKSENKRTVSAQEASQLAQEGYAYCKVCASAS